MRVPSWFEVFVTLPTKGTFAMPSLRIPKYRHYKPKDLALVVLSGKQIYLGKHGSPESWDEYHRLVKEFRADPAACPAPTSPSRGCSIDELIAAYWQQHVVSYYVKNGRPTSEQDNIRQALRFLRPNYGHTRARDFSPRGLKAVRQAMIEAGRCRPVVNNDVDRIKRMFRWAVEHEFVPVSVLPGLADGRRAPQGAIRGSRARAGRAGPGRARGGDPALRHDPRGRDDPAPTPDRGPARRDHGDAAV